MISKNHIIGNHTESSIIIKSEEIFIDIGITSRS